MFLIFFLAGTSIAAFVIAILNGRNALNDELISKSEMVSVCIFVIYIFFFAANEIVDFNLFCHSIFATLGIIGNVYDGKIKL